MSCGEKTVDLKVLKETDFERYTLFVQSMDVYFEREHPGKLAEGFQAQTFKQSPGNIEITYVQPDTGESLTVMIERGGCSGCNGCG